MSMPLLQLPLLCTGDDDEAAGGVGGGVVVMVMMMYLYVLGWSVVGCCGLRSASSIVGWRGAFSRYFFEVSRQNGYHVESWHIHVESENDKK
jgi:hypothetical protein